MSSAPVRTVPELLRRLVAVDPGRPRLTWYGPDGERVELSARTLENWVAKSANLLVEEFDAGPGSEVAVVLPPHWRTATWLLAVWSVGACAVVPAQGAAPAGQCDAVVTADPAAAVAAGVDPRLLVGIALPALAPSFGPGLPAGALDGAAEVRTRGDVFVPPVEPAPDDTALAVGGSEPVPYGRLLELAAGARLPPRPRLLTSSDAAGAVDGLLAPLLGDGSVVLLAPGLDAERVERIAEQENVDVRSR